MNKELIKKYKKEFDYWLNDGDVIWKSQGGTWRSVNDINCFRLGSVHNSAQVATIVINDKYAELRKAQTEGKIIQYKTNNSNWTDYVDIQGNPCSIFGTGGIYNYRIKPE